MIDDYRIECQKGMKEKAKNIILVAVYEQNKRLLTLHDVEAWWCIAGKAELSLKAFRVVKHYFR